MTVAVDGFDSGFSPVDGTEPMANLYQFAGTHDNGDWSFGAGYSVTVNLTDPDRRIIALNFGFVNLTDEVHTYTVFAGAPVAAIPGGSFITANAQATLNDSDFSGFAQLTNAMGVGAYGAIVDGSTVGSLLDPLDLTVAVPGGGATSGPDSFGIPPGSLAGPPLDTDFGAVFSFTLTPGDSASFTSSFLITPAPGALALFGAAAVLGSRRRRRTS
jgi:hypothetical protein